VKLLTLARDLRRRKARERQGRFVAEGVRAVEELLASALPVHGLLVAPGLEAGERGRELLERASARGVPIQPVSEAELASAADTESPQGVLAIGDVPDRSLDALAPRDGARLVVLDGLQDPGNVGTILRTAAAFGFGGLVALPGTVDLWNAKVVRSAMGALFHMPTATADLESFGTFLARYDVPLWAADAHGAPLDVASRPVPPRLALALGNEGAGLSPALRARADHLVAIPIASGVESLNVAVAAGILLHALRA
jgi:TrmH family RNA methyltransferase